MPLNLRLDDHSHVDVDVTLATANDIYAAAPVPATTFALCD